MKKLMALTALTILTACDYIERADFDRERADRLYKSAMEDYRAGRVDAAVKGFQSVVRKDPANASARFQLACLLQDAKADYLGAFCAYREYLAQHPDSDKAKLASDRLAKCETELAKQLCVKHGLSNTEGLVKEIGALKQDLRSAETREASIEKEVETLRARITSLQTERERLLAMIKGDTLGDPEAEQRTVIRGAKDLLEETEEIDRIKMSEDIAALRADEEEEELSTGSSLLPTGRVARVVKKQEQPKREVKPVPETYVVQEGDTLYGISKRFYGRLSVWKTIRDMNKAIISADNRLHVGDTLRLPRP